MRRILDWLIEDKTQKILSLLGACIVSTGGAVWTGYTFFYTGNGSKGELRPPAADRKSEPLVDLNQGVVAGRDVVINAPTQFNTAPSKSFFHQIDLPHSEVLYAGSSKTTDLKIFFVEAADQYDCSQISQPVDKIIVKFESECTYFLINPLDNWDPDSSMTSVKLNNVYFKIYHKKSHTQKIVSVEYYYIPLPDKKKFKWIFNPQKIDFGKSGVVEAQYMGAPLPNFMTCKWYQTGNYEMIKQLDSCKFSVRKSRLNYYSCVNALYKSGEQLEMMCIGQ